MKLLLSLKSGGEVREAASVDEAHRVLVEWSRELGGVQEFNVTRADVVCDFCSTPGIVSLYQITPGTPRSIEISDRGTITHVDQDGLWGACPTCDEIIESIRVNQSQKDVIRLRNRAAFLFMETEEGAGLPSRLVEYSVEMGHNFFLTHWDGKPSKPLATDDEIMGAS